MHNLWFTLHRLYIKIYADDELIYFVWKWRSGWEGNVERGNLGVGKVPTAPAVQPMSRWKITITTMHGYQFHMPGHDTCVRKITYD